MKELKELRWFISDGLDNYDEGVKVSEIWDKVNELIQIKERELPIEDSLKNYSEKEIEDAYNKGYNDGANEASTEIYNSL